MEGLADITDDVLAAMRYALRFKFIFARESETVDAHRGRFARRHVDQYEYG